MDDVSLLIDLHREGHRQGPGGDAETQQALGLAGVDRSAPLKVADIGCGTGASALLLARLLNARFTAVDFLPEFLQVLRERAQSMGVAAWRRFLKPGGVLVASEITWTTASRPAEIQRHWDGDDPDIDVASAKIGILEQHGYSPIGAFVLPERCWLEEYYRPLQARFASFQSRHGHSEEARAFVGAEQREIELYETYKDFYGYGFYIARKVPG
jgi:SAM-dependent methyltransferase